MNQAAFNRANVKLFRTQLATEINSGDPDVILTSSESNFSPKDAAGAAINPYIVSQGKLPKVDCSWIVPTEASETESMPEIVAVQEQLITTYAQLVSYLGLQKGDQLTAIALTCDDTEDGASSLFNGFHYGRFILEPDDGDMTHLLTDTTHWNAKNENIHISPIPTTGGIILVPSSTQQKFGKGFSDSVVGFAIIASRLVGSTWSRSDAQLLLKPWTVGTAWHLSQDHGELLLSDAILSYMSDTSSLLYLNQAEV